MSHLPEPLRDSVGMSSTGLGRRVSFAPETGSRNLDFVASAHGKRRKTTGNPSNHDVAQLPFDHPVAIEYLSQTAAEPLTSSSDSGLDLEYPPAATNTVSIETHSTLEFTTTVAALLVMPDSAAALLNDEDQPADPPLHTIDADESMDFTRPIRFTLMAQVNSALADNKDERTIGPSIVLVPSFRPSSGIRAGLSLMQHDEQGNKLVKLPESDIEKHAHLVSIEDEQTMEFTTPIRLQPQKPNPLDSLEEEQTMELTEQVRPQPEKPNSPHPLEEEQTMEFTEQVRPQPEKPNSPHPLEEEQTMEFTKPVRPAVDMQSHFPPVEDGQAGNLSESTIPNSGTRTHLQALDDEQSMDLTQQTPANPLPITPVKHGQSHEQMSLRQDKNEKSDMGSLINKEQVLSLPQIMLDNAELDQEQTMKFTRPMRIEAVNADNQGQLVHEPLLLKDDIQKFDLDSSRNHNQLVLPPQMTQDSAEFDQEQTMDFTRPMKAQQIHADIEDRTTKEPLPLEIRATKSDLEPSSNQESSLLLPQMIQDSTEPSQKLPVETTDQSPSLANNSAQFPAVSNVNSEYSESIARSNGDQSEKPFSQSEAPSDNRSLDSVQRANLPLDTPKKSVIEPVKGDVEDVSNIKAGSETPQSRPASLSTLAASPVALAASLVALAASLITLTASPQNPMATSQSHGLSPQLSTTHSNSPAIHNINPSGLHLDTIDEHSIEGENTLPISPVDDSDKQSYIPRAEPVVLQLDLAAQDNEAGPLAERGSQPMDLTQDGVLAADIPIISPTLDALTIDAVPAIDESSVHKSLTTTHVELPVAEVASANPITIAEVNDNGDPDEDDLLDEDAPDLAPIPLDQFLRDTGVSFTTDLGTTSHIESPESDLEADLSVDQYFRAYPKLELVTLNEFYNGEMQKNIEQAGQVFSDFAATIAHTTPPFLRQYYLASDDERNILNSKVRMTRELAGAQLRILWHQWRLQLWRSLVSQLQVRRDNLVLSKDQIARDLEGLASLQAQTKEACQELLPKLEILRRLKESASTLDALAATALKDDITSLFSKLKTTKEQVAQMVEQINKSQRQLSLAQQECDAAADSLEKQRRATPSRPNLSATEIKALTYKYALLKGILGLEPHTMEGNVINFIYRKSLKLTVDFHRKCLRIADQVDGGGEFLCGGFLKKILPSVARMVEGSASVQESFVKLERLWPSLKIVDRDIYKVKLGFPVEFESASENSIECAIAYIDSDGVRTDLAYTIDLGFLDLYPRSAVLKIPDRTDSAIEFMKREKFLHHLFTTSTVSLTSGSDQVKITV